MAKTRTRDYKAEYRRRREREKDEAQTFRLELLARFHRDSHEMLPAMVAEGFSEDEIISAFSDRYSNLELALLHSMGVFSGEVLADG